ncbi:TetR/AcrR family transcriptional regulator [Pseudogracilibacillus auburnensis]|uniref:TetR/AcrR family transcriptional regulator n=1 Tax=Pseudogracilibacillus auburnensis TaxID=1494959 RepID=UPI001A95FB47|nr:TetR/AcrR family transcriptional regulator [Pseudogracilibacillus auburnensis]MBO1001229.1 TetR/AcrR family transcriptional regulator [Pseudogracilibacillus auburnensis]
MAPRTKFSKEQIIDSAFFIAKSEGIDRITIRKVAAHLGSSSAPIYVNFNDVEELKQAVVNKIVELSQQMIKEQNTGNPFADIGIASLKMATEYPVLIRNFVLKPNEYLKEYDQEMGGNFTELMKQDPELKGFTDDELMTILLKMRIFQTGLTLMVANGLLPKEFNLDKMLELSDSVAGDIVLGTRSRKEERKRN